MSELSIFQYKHNQVRVALIGGQPWWVASDVCAVLGIQNPTDALTRLDDDEKGTLDSTEGGPGRRIVSEAGLYSLILGSRKPEAKEFKRWVTHDVLPTIRKTGTYSVFDDPRFEIPESYSGALRVAAELAEDNERLTAENAEQGRQIKTMTPYAVFGKALSESDGACRIGTFVKCIRVDGRVIGRNKFFRFLRNQKILMSSGSNKNEPYQVHVDAGRFRVRESLRPNSAGEMVPCFTTLITPKGQGYVVMKMRNDKDFWGLSVEVDKSRRTETEAASAAVQI